METHGLMPHNDRFPLLSRDWEDIDCQTVSCQWNKNNKCGMSSLAKIGEDGRCIGFQPIGLLKVINEAKSE